MRINKLSLLVCILALVNIAWAKPPTAQIVDGTRVSATEYPFVARLLVGGQTQCTGTLVGSRHVLTAGHCFFGGNNKRAVGDTDMVADLGGQQIRSSKVYINPAYRSRSQACVEGETDAAVIELESSPAGITPVAIVDTVPPAGSAIQLAGFGLEGTGSEGQSDNLPPDGLINIGNTIIEGLGANPPQQNPNSSYFFWTFDSGEANTASGDSGGPAFFQSGTERQIAGITCGGEDNAQIGTLSFNTRGDLIKSWVLSITGATPTNTAPGFSSSKSLIGSLGSALSYRVPVTGTAPVTVTVTGLPDGLTFDGTNITGTPSVSGKFTAQISASNAFGSAATDLEIVISGFESSLTIQKVLLQFDFVKSSDFLDLTGKINVGKNFKVSGKKVTVQIGRFVKQFKMRSDGLSATGNKNFFDLVGNLSNGKFKNSTVRYFLTLERQSIFDELATLGFPSSLDASAGQEVVLPLTVTVDGIESTASATLVFSERDARWRIKR